MVRLSVDERSPLELKRDGRICEVLMDDRVVLRASVVDPLLHCPQQAYITVSERCIYDCKFCAVPRLQGGIKSRQTVRQMVEWARESGDLQAISLTSGVEISPQVEGRRIAEIVMDLSGFRIPIGVSVSPYPGVNRDLKAAGTDEVKYNLEAADPNIFSRVCPGIGFQGIMDALEEAVGVFGKGRVFTNIIVGLGESDKMLCHTVDELAEMGVMPVLRAVFPHPLRLGDVEMVRPSAPRQLRLARHLKAALDRNDLDGKVPLTGCYRCTGCDLVPHRDL